MSEKEVFFDGEKAFWREKNLVQRSEKDLGTSLRFCRSNAESDDEEIVATH